MSKKYNISPFPFGEESPLHPLFPIPMRCLVVGLAGCGKTTLLCNMIVQPWAIPCVNHYVCSTRLDQKFYKILKNFYIRYYDMTGTIKGYFYNNCDEIIALEDCMPCSLVTFDDCDDEPQRVINDYYARVSNNISCVYLNTSYDRVDKKSVRKNLNFMCIFIQFIYDLYLIYEEYVGSDFTFKRFNEICLECWTDDFGFLTINMDKQLKDGRYMKKFGEYFLT